MPSSLVRRMRTVPILGVGDTAAVTTLRLDIQYDGAGFRGWARQPGLRTVQSELETALETVLREPVELTVAGRTDTGVHALGQVASFDTAAEPPQDLTRRLNGLCPDDVAVTAATVVNEGFDARRDAKARSYRYRLLARSAPSPFELGRALWWPHRIDREALDGCAAALPGNHDFTAFTPTQTDHVHFERDVLAAGWEIDGDILSFHITADAFMRNMVRVLVGTQLEVASGRRTVENFWKEPPEPRPETRPHPTVSTSRPSGTRRARGRPSRSSRTSSDRA
jgi:tRNA pseudouridine38-40 synthase